MGVAYSRNKLALRTMLRNFNLKSQFSIFDSLRDIHIYDFLKFVGSLWPLKWTGILPPPLPQAESIPEPPSDAQQNLKLKLKNIGGMWQPVTTSVAESGEHTGAH